MVAFGRRAQCDGDIEDLTDVLPLSLVAWAAFLSTSLDSLFVLVPVLSREQTRARAVFQGYLGALAAIVAVSWGAAQVGEAIFPRALYWLGLIPVGMGIALLVRGLLPVAAAEPTEPATRPATATAAALLTLSLGGDNLGVFIPLFADTSRSLDLLIAANLLAAGVAWSLAALAISRRRRVRGWLERWGPRLIPFFLIAVGIYILADTPTDLS